MRYDVIIIGSGLGGLTAGAKLANEGKKVLVIEQHDKAGGCSTTFKRQGYTIDVGLHTIDGMDKHDHKVALFEELGSFSEIEFVPTPNFYRFVSDRTDIIIPDNPSEAISVLEKQFPEEKEGIRKYYQTILGIYEEVHKIPEKKWKRILKFMFMPITLPNIMKYARKTIGEFIDDTIDNEELKLVLLANLQFYGDDPYKVAMLYFGPAQGSFFMGGAHYIKGGSQKLSDHFVDVIERNGGKVILNHLVTKIITENNKAVGVEYKSVKDQEAKSIRENADIIIANAAVPNVAYDLLDEDVAQDLRQKIERFEIAPSHTSLYVGLDKPLKELGNKTHNTFFFNGLTKMSDMGDNAKDDFSVRRFGLTDYSQIDARVSQKNKSIVILCMTDYIEDWENLSKEEYKGKKEQVKETLINRMEKHYPGFKDAIVFAELATPKTMVRYTLNPGGTSFGYAPLPSQTSNKRLQNKSEIDSLYFASAWVFPGGGFSAVMISGYNCAKEILKELNKTKLN